MSLRQHTTVTDRVQRPARPAVAARAAADTATGDVLQLQRAFGNRAVTQLQRQTLAGGELDSQISDTINRSRGGGQPLPDQIRGSMESAFRSDFGGVRVHTDQSADTLNRAVQAKAFTLGNDIYFRKGNYQPGNSSGQELLAHELTHVVQQGGSSNHAQGKLTVGPVGDRYEQEADRVAKQVTRGAAAPQSQAVASGVQRAPQHIQRYQASTKNYTATNNDPGVAHMFASQSIDPVVDQNNQLRHDTQHDAHPSLYFSDDYTLAINKAKQREAKEFYATDAVIATANHALAAAGSAVQLVKNDNVTLTSPSPTQNQPLKMIKPSITLNALTTAGDTASFGTSVCIDVAMKVMGNLSGDKSTQAVFDPPGVGQHTENFTPDNTQSKAVFKLANFVAGNTGGQNPTTGDMHTAMTDPTHVAAADAAYGKKTNSKERVARARVLAINQFARPEVGEGFATYSTRPRGGKKKTWGYHYAGVIARSPGGTDWVTLENYNRTGDVKAAAEKIYKNLMKQNKAIILAKITQLQQQMVAEDVNTRAMTDVRIKDLQKQNSIYKALKETMVAIAENQGRNRAAGEAEYEQALATEPKTKWFFHMYGTGKGQSFHEQAVKSDYFSNALTMRVRKQ